MDQHANPTEGPVTASLKATYRALLARGLEAGEAANLTAFLHGLPSAGFRWSLPEIDAIIHRRIAHAAEQRTATARQPALSHGGRHRRPGAPGRRQIRSGSTHVIDPPST